MHVKLQASFGISSFLFALGFLFLIVFLPSVAQAGSIDDFEDYAYGDLDVVTSDNWGYIGVDKDYEIISSPVFAGTKSLGCDANTCGTPTTSASDLVGQTRYLHTGYIYNEGRGQTVRIKDTTDTEMINIRFQANGDFETSNDATTTDQQNAYATSTWIYFQIDINFTTGQFRANIDDGVFSTWIDFTSTSNGIPAEWEFNSVSATAGTMFAFDNWGSDSTGLDDIPPITESYIVMTSPPKINGIRNLAYNATWGIQLNNILGATSTYKISIISQGGLSYFNFSGTTTDSTAFDITENEVYGVDDVIYVKWYLYNGESESATDLIDVSPEYEVWISANANPLEPIDGGVFRSLSTTTCSVYSGFGATSSVLSYEAFSFALCNVGRALFVPSFNSVNSIGDKVSVATATAPFSYVWDSGNYLDTLFSATTTVWSIGMSSTSAYLADFTIISSTMIEGVPRYNDIRTALGWIFWLLFVLYVFRRALGILNPQPDQTFEREDKGRTDHLGFKQ